MAMSDKLKPLAFLVQTDHQIIGTDAEWWGRSKVMFKYLAWGIVGAAIMAGLYFGLPTIILGSIGFFAILLGAASGIGAALLATGLREAFHQHQTNPLSTAGKIAVGLMMLATVILPFVAVPSWLIAVVAVSCVFSIWPVVATALFFFKKNRVHTVVNVDSETAKGVGPTASQIFFEKNRVHTVANVDSETAKGAGPTASQMHADALVALQAQLPVAQRGNCELENQSKPTVQGGAASSFEEGGSSMSFFEDAQLLTSGQIELLNELEMIKKKLSDAQSTIASLEAQVEAAKAASQEEIAQLRVQLNMANADLAAVKETDDHSVVELEAELALREAEILALTQRVGDLEELLAQDVVATSDGDGPGTDDETDAQVIQRLQDRIVALQSELCNAKRDQRRVGIFKDGAHNKATRREDSRHHAVGIAAEEQAVAAVKREKRQVETSSRRTIDEYEREYLEMLQVNTKLEHTNQQLMEELARFNGLTEDCDKYEGMLKIAFGQWMRVMALQKGINEPSQYSLDQQIGDFISDPDGVNRFTALAEKLDQSLSPDFALLGVHEKDQGDTSGQDETDASLFFPGGAF